MSAQEAPQKRPRGTQERPRDAQERPKDAQETPGRRPDPSKIEPGTPRDASWAHSSQEPLFERLPDQFLIVFCVARGRADMCFDMVFSIRNACRTLSALQARVHEKTSKNTWFDPPKPSPDPPETLQNRTPGAPGRPKNSQDEPKPVKKRPRSTQERKKAPTNEKCANIVPT